MTLPNPIEEIVYKTLEPGVYEGVLENITTGKSKGKEGEYTTIIFEFNVPTEQIKLRRSVSAQNGPNGGLVKVLRGMCGSQLTEAIRTDREKLWTLTQSCKGKSYMLTTSLSPDLKYTNIEAISPMRTLTQVVRSEAPNV